MTENTGKKQVSGGTGKFQKGVSGNLKGRPKGSRNKATIAAEALLDTDAGQITGKCIELAKAGNVSALRLCMERLLPPRKSRPLNITLPNIETAADVLRSVNAVLLATAKGDLTLEEAEGLLRIIEAARSALEVEELHGELDELKQRMELVVA